MLSRSATIFSKRLPVIMPRASINIARASMSMYMYNPIEFDPIDPDKIFDEIDVAGTGTISREEFKAALGRLRYADLVKVHEAAEANLKALNAKLETLDEIEKDLDELKTISKQKQDVYNNIGMTTAADIEVLFDVGRMTRKRVQSNVSELKEKLSETRDAYNNIGMTTAADLDALFKDDKSKKAA